MSKPKPPADLAAPGRTLWRDTVAVYDLSPPELRLLGEASRATDELARLRAVLLDVDVVVCGSTGQPRPHPVFDEVRRHRESLAKLIAALDLPADSEPVTTSDKARQAARARWAKRGA